MDLNSFESWHYPLTNVSENEVADLRSVNMLPCWEVKDVSDWGGNVGRS